MSSIITQIWTTVVKDFTAAEQWIDNAVARVDAVLPGAGSAVQSTAKQYASDALGYMDTTMVTYEPSLAKAVEAGIDVALNAATGGKALPLVGMTNAAVDRVLAIAVAAAHSKALQIKAQMAENNAVGMTGGATTLPPNSGQAISPPPLPPKAV